MTERNRFLSTLAESNLQTLEQFPSALLNEQTDSLPRSMLQSALEEVARMKER